MKIKSISIEKANLDLTRPYTIAYKTVDSVENIILRLELENGIFGLGASNPSIYVVGTDIEQTLAFMTEERLSIFKGRDIRCFFDLLGLAYSEFKGYAGAQVALDIALHDAFAQYLGIPVAGFYGQKIKSLPTSVTIGIMDVDKTLAEAKEYLDAGFKVLKVKLGKSLSEDIDRIKALRNTYGNEPIIRIDANQGWTKDETIRFFEQTGSLQIELVEQPVKADSILQLSDLPEDFKALVAADESLVNSLDAERLVAGDSPCGIFNIKLMKCGGIHEAKKIADVAERNNIDLMWGCNDESIISIAAGLHAALSSPNTKYIDLDGSFDLAKDVVSGGFELKDGYLSLLNKPGLGLTAL